MSADKFRRVLAAGEILFREGEAGREAYCLESGRIQLSDQPDISAGPGEILGIAALTGEALRPCTAVATEACVVSVISEESLAAQIAQADPMLGRLLNTALAQYHQAARGPRSATPAESGDLEKQRRQLELDLELALARDEFTLQFQPVIRLADDGIAGFEALLRWMRPGFGRTLPNEFLWAIEASDLAAGINEWVIRHACESLSRLQAVHKALQADNLPLFVSVNLSVRQFDDPQFFQALGNILGAEWLAPRQLRLEINEAQIAPNLAAVEALLARCKALGVKLIIDHFGTGQSALTYLHRLPVDGIKFDEGLIHDMATHDVSLRVAQAVNDLAASLDIDTGAAGVETAEQVVATRAAGFGLAQGFHYAPPLNFDDCASFLKARAASAKKAGLSR